MAKKKNPSIDEIRKAALQPLPPAVKKETPAAPVLKPRKKHKLHPRMGWVLVRKTSLDEEVTEAGLVLNREKVVLHQGVIEGLGPEAAANGLSVGMRVMFSAFAMKLDDVELLTGDKNLIQVRHTEVYSVIEELDEFITTLPGQVANADRVQA